MTTGYPVRGSVNTGEYNFYRVPLTAPNASITLLLTRLSGDPDLYASFTIDKPTSQASNYSAAEMGDDTIFISHYEVKTKYSHFRADYKLAFFSDAGLGLVIG